MLRLLSVAALFAGLFTTVAPAAEPAAGKDRPLEVLYITGGCCHDYESQKQILVPGLESRANVRLTVVHEGGSSLDHKVSVYAQPDWSKGYDVVFHNECFADM